MAGPPAIPRRIAQAKGLRPLRPPLLHRFSPPAGIALGLGSQIFQRSPDGGKPPAQRSGIGGVLPPPLGLKRYGLELAQEWLAIRIDIKDMNAGLGPDPRLLLPAGRPHPLQRIGQLKQGAALAFAGAPVFPWAGALAPRRGGTLRRRFHHQVTRGQDDEPPHGGFGGTAVDLIGVMQAFGDALVVEPYVPTVVLGGAGLVMFGMVAATGIRILGGVDFKTNRFNALIVAISIGIGMIPLIAPNFKQWMPHGLHPLIESGILLASLSSVLLNLFFNGASADSRDAIEAAKQAEAH